MDILDVRKLIRGKIIGITCHNSITLADTALKNKADYIAFGSFLLLKKQKKVKYKASINLLRKVRKITKKTYCSNWGYKPQNYENALLNKANLLAISGYIWEK